MSDSRLRVVLGWHMHQPEYRDPTTGEFRLPWTYLHAMKDYSDMAAHLEAEPAARAVVNFAPLLLEQLDHYGLNIRGYLAHGTPMRDTLLDALVATDIPHDGAWRAKLIDAALRINVERMVNRYPAFRLLASEAARLRKEPEQLLNAPAAFFADLVTWYHLAWFGEFVQREDRQVQALIAQQRSYALAQRRLILQKIGELVDGIIPRYRKLAEQGRVELSLTPYGHPILPLLIDIESAHQAMPGAPLPEPPDYPGGLERSRWHLQRAAEVFGQHFGFRPAGVWCSEGAVSEATLSLLDEFGAGWTVTGESVLTHSSLGQAPADRAYRVGSLRTPCYFRDDDLSDRIGFRYAIWHGDDAAKDLIGTLDAMAQYGDPGRVVSIFLDGENAWEHYPANGYYFLTALYAGLAHHPRLRLTTFSEALGEGAAVGQLQHLTAGSWVRGSLSTWIGSTDKNRGWEHLIRAKRAYDGVAGRLDPEALRAAEHQLAVCEGSDWFWWLGDDNPAGSVADFEQLYRHQLTRLYELIGVERPEALDQVLSLGRGSPAVGGVMKPGTDETVVPAVAATPVAERHPVLAQRRCGVLLHITSLPGGDFSHDAYRFIEWLAEAGISVWQVLPMGPTHADRSPYLALSANAGNPLMISLAWLLDRGWLADYDPHAANMDAEKRRAIKSAYDGFCDHGSADLQRQFRAFCDAQAEWLDDYALFAVINGIEQGRSWVEWPAALRDRDPQALAQARQDHADALLRIAFEQFLFFTQWAEIRDYAHRHGVYIFGDLPLFVAYHSADVWAHRELFCVDSHGTPLKVAGVPPDYFSEDGQVWGNPQFDWPVHERQGFRWWIRRMRNQVALYDLVRIDHFRGLEAYWELEGDARDARNGRWVKSPGKALLHTLHDALHPLPLIAEDLGEITPEVNELRRHFSLPGMRVLQFAFDGDADSVHLPHNYTEPLVAYTGTHDNATSLEWWQTRNDHQRETLRFYALHPDEPAPWPLIHTALGSAAALAMVPLQDFLGLGAEGRMNTPGTVERNWAWRFGWDQMPPDLKHRIRWLNERYARL